MLTIHQSISNVLVPILVLMFHTDTHRSVKKVYDVGCALDAPLPAHCDAESVGSYNGWDEETFNV